MQQWTQVLTQDLIEYVDKVNQLIQDHDKQTQELSDIRALTDIVDKTWKTRLEALENQILNQYPRPNNKHQQGLIKAYNIMKGHI